MRNWEIKSLQEVTNLITCGVAARPEYYDEGVPFLSAKNVKNGQLFFEDYRFISESKHAELTKNNKPEIGDILYTRVGSYGEAAIIDIENEFSIFVSLTLIKPKRELLDNHFLKYYLNSDTVKKIAKSSINGVGVGNLNVGTVRKFQIPIPALSEQQAIVEKLDTAFELIDRAKVNIEQNIQNAKELFQSKLNQVFSQKGEGWEEKKLGEIGKVSMCKRIMKDQTLPEGDIPFYKIGTFGKSPNAFISKEIFNEYSTKYSYPKKGEILLSASGTIGRCVVFDGEPSFFQDSNIVWISNNEELVLNQFLFQFYKVCDWNPSKGATISRLYNDDLRRIIINFPTSLEMQKKIVGQIELLSEQTDLLHHKYQQELANLDDLKKSILEKAFKGELL